MIFLNPLFLAALFALAIPIIVHLLKSKKVEITYLGTIRFLMQAKEQSAKRSKLKNLLLLLLRLLIIALIVFVFARPLFGGKEQKEVMIFIDASGSMKGQTASIERIDLAILKAKEIINDVKGTSKVRIFFCSDDILEVKSIQEEVKAGGLLEYKTVFEFIKREFNNSSSSSKEMYLISDFQKISLPEKPVADFPENIKVNLINLANSLDSNYAITKVRNLTEYVGQESEIEVEFQHSGAESNATKLDFELLIEGQEVIKKSVPVTTKKIKFKWQAKKHGIYKGKISLVNKDSFPLDNTRDFILNIKAPRKILIVNGYPTLNRLKSPGYFIQKVLETSKSDNITSGFDVSTSLKVANLKDYEAIALCDINSFSADEIKALQDFITRGGGVAFFLGNNTDENHFNTLTEKGIFPAKITKRKSSHHVFLNQWNEENEIFAVFSKTESFDGIKRFIFKNIFDIKVANDAKIISSFNDSSVAIFEKNTDKNKIIVMSNPCDRSVSDWPIERAFVPFIRGLFNSFFTQNSLLESYKETFLSIKDSREVGIYSSPTEVIVPNRLESIITSVDEKTFRKRMGLMTNKNIKNIDAFKTEERELWVILLIILLCVLPIENLLADRRLI